MELKILTKNARASIKINRSRKYYKLPSRNDIRKIHEHPKNEIDFPTAKLDDNFIRERPTALYGRLRNLVLSKLMLFNGRRSVELVRTPVDRYKRGIEMKDEVTKEQQENFKSTGC